MNISEVLRLVNSNGILELGIAAGADPALSDDHKFPCLDEPADSEGYKGRATTTALHRIDSMNIQNIHEKKLVVCAAVGLIRFGWIDRNSSDVKRVPFSEYTGTILPFTEQDIRDALSLVLATKLNLYTSNHHVGQGVLTGYPLKAYNMLLNREHFTEKSIYTIIHMLGHWASTNHVLSSVGFEGLAGVSGVAIETPLTVSDDVMMRLRSHPAGTGKLYVAYSTLRKLLASDLASYTPNLAEMRVIVDEYKKVAANPARYHIGSKHLTGLDRIMYNEGAVNNCLGRLGTFICHMYPRSTLAMSPAYKRNQSRIYETYDDFDENYASLCATYKENVARALATRTFEGTQALRTGNVSVIPELKALIASGMSTQYGSESVAPASDALDTLGDPLATDIEDASPRVSRPTGVGKSKHRDGGRSGHGGHKRKP